MPAHKLTVHKHQPTAPDGIPVNVQVWANKPDSVYVKAGFGPGSEHWTPKHPWSRPGRDEKTLGELINLS